VDPDKFLRDYAERMISKRNGGIERALENLVNSGISINCIRLNENLHSGEWSLEVISPEEFYDIAWLNWQSDNHGWEH
jgi:hypothetical protein